MVTDLCSTLVLISITAWRQVMQLGPYVIGGVLMAALLGQFDLRRWWSRLSRSSPASILGAACAGGLSPLSTYGTVPMLGQLLREGASPGPVLAFLVASSMVNPQLFFLVLGGLGARLALAQLVGILILSLIVGWAATRMPSTLFLQPSAVSSLSVARPPFTWKRCVADVIRTLDWIGLTFIAGVILSAAIQVIVPPSWVTWLIGQSRWIGVLAAGILGVPLYACGGSAVPVLAGLTRMGMGSGAALAFLLSGPATRVTALAAMGSLLNRRALIAYVVYIVMGAAVMGLVLGR